MYSEHHAVFTELNIVVVDADFFNIPYELERAEFSQNSSNTLSSPPHEVLQEGVIWPPPPGI